ncbi:Predicted N-formylglutamate amidohydrolase [Parasphingorhabdus marina DSM 22363]|uniref:Predicted N-formylglutamate amidohydrolase n=1 Tax=Parasphingorhabdus marina DSM 22363 TaxID=1123272 RepID=A0A1N6FL78_9SPHN|nr:N-formylglutamate amidohydrolase [Parasphingorhabdus marina]SIN96027.1 Predicted N-formylglutamate amidohydrolase [Parasphingorhabdus marina DSM 22363]
MTDAFKILGSPQPGQLLIVADHASSFVPPDIDLGISQTFHKDHIAVDIGTMEIARMMTEKTSHLAIAGGVSRLVVDLNRYPDERSVVPEHSDGVQIHGNRIDDGERQRRLDRYFHPYHDQVSRLISELKPSLVLSLHSFTPSLRSNRNIERPWEIGVLYNYYDTASKLAFRYLEEEKLIVGDQFPYSGKDLNATMNRQAEAIDQPYLGVEIRQDLIGNEMGQRHFAELLLRTCDKVRTGLASGG